MASKDFSDTLKKLRLKAGYSQKQVYEHFNIPQSTFSSWEVGKSEPSAEMLIKLCNFYNCDLLNEFSYEADESFTYSEIEIIKKYRSLDTHGKKMVDFTLQEEWERSTEQNNVISLPNHLEIKAARNDYIDEDGEIEKTERDLGKLKPPSSTV